MITVSISEKSTADYLEVELDSHSTVHYISFSSTSSTSSKNKTAFYKFTGTVSEKKSQFDNPFMFGGVFFDQETGFYQMRYRYYDPRLRGFLSRDPIEDDSLGNLYAAFENNSGTYIDPMGLGIGDFLGGVVDVIAEPFRAAADLVVAGYAAANDIPLDDVDFSSGSAQAAQSRRMQGQGSGEAFGKTLGETAANTVTMGMYTQAELTSKYLNGEMTFDEYEAAMHRAGGGAAAGLAGGAKARARARAQPKGNGGGGKPPKTQPRTGGKDNSCPLNKKGKPKAAKNFEEPTNPPQNPPKSGNLPEGHSVRVMPPTEQYPNGYWVQTNKAGNPINPSTGKPATAPKGQQLTRSQSRSQTHIPLPPK